MYSLGRSLNLAFENTKITTKRVMVQEDLYLFSMHAKSHNTMYVIVNLEDITDVTPLGVIPHNINPH